MTFHEKVVAKIDGAHPSGLCDKCILAALGEGNVSMVNESTRRLAKGGSVLGFVREKGRCYMCKANRLTVCYVGVASGRATVEPGAL